MIHIVNFCKSLNCGQPLCSSNEIQLIENPIGLACGQPYGHLFSENLKVFIVGWLKDVGLADSYGWAKIKVSSKISTCA